MVHGDDFICLSAPNALDEMQACFRRWWDIKLRRVVGNDIGDIREIDILKRKLIWDGAKLMLRADQRHREMGIKGNSKGVPIPYEDDNSMEDVSEHLESICATKFRSMSARINYLSLDRPDMQFAAKRVCQGMAKLKRIARYLANGQKGHWSLGRREDHPGCCESMSTQTGQDARRRVSPQATEWQCGVAA